VSPNPGSIRAQVKFTSRAPRPMSNGGVAAGGVGAMNFFHACHSAAMLGTRRITAKASAAREQSLRFVFHDFNSRRRSRRTHAGDLRISEVLHDQTHGELVYRPFSSTNAVSFSSPRTMERFRLSGCAKGLMTLTGFKPTVEISRCCAISAQICSSLRLKGENENQRVCTNRAE
jgi:hypothetical protein